MNQKSIKKIVTIALLTALLPMGVSFAEEVNPIPTLTDGFRYAITPYVWLPGISGTVDVNNSQIGHTHIGNGKVLDNLSIGGMIEGEVHYDRWGLMGNAIYAKLSNNSSRTDIVSSMPVSVNSTADTWMGIYTLAGTYTAYVDPSVYLDVLVGARVLNLNAKVQLNASVANTPYTGAATLYSSVSATDAIGGVKGRVRLGESSFFVPFYLDAGGGSAVAKFTSQQMLGVGYAFKDADVSILWNNLYYSLSNNNVSSYINMTGPAIAATFRF